MRLIFNFRFISVSNALPKTSYVKMVDVWLLFNLVVPFVEVSLSNINKSTNYGYLVTAWFHVVVGLDPNTYRALERKVRGQSNHQSPREETWGWRREGCQYFCSWWRSSGWDHSCDSFSSVSLGSLILWLCSTIVWYLQGRVRWTT